MVQPDLFVHRFTTAWDSQDVTGLLDLLHDDVELRQPLIRPIHGREAAGRSLQRVIDAISGVAVDVRSWAARGNTVFIEFALTGSDGTRLRMVDRFELRGDRAVFRLNYQDLRDIYSQVARRPGLGRRLRRTGAGLRGAGPALPAPLTVTGDHTEFSEGMCSTGLPGVGAQRVVVVRPRSGARPTCHYVTSTLAMTIPAHRLRSREEPVT